MISTLLWNYKQFLCDITVRQQPTIKETKIEYKKKMARDAKEYWKIFERRWKKDEKSHELKGALPFFCCLSMRSLYIVYITFRNKKKFRSDTMGRFGKATINLNAFHKKQN